MGIVNSIKSIFSCKKSEVPSNPIASSQQPEAQQIEKSAEPHGSPIASPKTRCFNYSCQGESHKATNKECQDYSLSVKDDDNGIYIAVVCDGHG